MKISNFEINKKRCFIIAEIGNNHNGSLNEAFKLIDSAIEAGADCVKFQMRNMQSVYRKKSLEKVGQDLGTEYVLDLLERFEFSKEQHKKVSEYCKKKNILYMCTPWDAKSVEILEDFDVPAYKVSSADLTNLPLINELINTKKPLILSTGMSSESEIQTTINFLKKSDANFILLHCNSTYPAPLHDINLKWMKKLSSLHPLVGYSGHERGIIVTLAAVALGAMVVERHLTLDRGLEGPDHAASLEPSEFEEMVLGIRDIEKALGNGKVRSISQGEMINRENLAKSLVAATDLKKGMTIDKEHIKILSPGQGLSPQYYENLLGRELKRDMSEEDYFFSSDLNDNRYSPRAYNFKRPWGVPVRYHDFHDYEEIISPDFYEFHLSYSDMSLKIEEFLKGTYESEFVVHAPELFAESQLMDLASSEEEYRLFSIKETQKVIDITRSLKKYFPKTSRPMIVANIGGYSMDEPLPEEEKSQYYERFAQSLNSLDRNGVEIIPQTMAPFPWHFGGQRYQNLFVQSEECLFWCKKLNLRMCLDTSHSKLMCNHYGIDFLDFIKKIAPITAHLHLGDAQGVNGEGLQIGEGDIDFKKLACILNAKCPSASFIPEIWQGHKNFGEGFWIALEKLEGII